MTDENVSGRAPVSDEELQRWAELRADDAGHLARELIGYRRAAMLPPVSHTGGIDAITARAVCYAKAIPPTVARQGAITEAYIAGVMSAKNSEDGNRPLPFDRDTLGRFVREAWVRWASDQPNPKPTWLAPYDDLSEADKEADRQIGETLARWTLIGDAARLSQVADHLRNIEATADAISSPYRMSTIRKQALLALAALGENPTPSPNSGGWKSVDSLKKGPHAVWLAHTCGYMSPAYFNPVGDGFWVHLYTNLPIDWRPTHWQELPTPPAAIASEGSEG